MSLQIQCNGCRKPFRAGIPDENGVLCPFCGHEVIPARRRAASARFRPNWQLLTAVGGLSAGLVATLAFGLAIPGEKSLWEEDLPVPFVKLDSDLDLLAQSLPAPASKIEQPVHEVEDVVSEPEPAVQLPIPPEVLAALDKARVQAAQPAAVAEPARPPLVFKKRTRLSDEDLRKQLMTVNEMSTSHLPRASVVTLLNAPKNRKYRPEEMPDFAGLPMRMGVDCQLGKEPADNLQALSRKLREFIGASMEGGLVSAEKLRGQLGGVAPRKGLNAKLEAGMWLQPEAVPTLNQMLMPESREVRLLLVQILDRIPGRAASEALVQRALYDLSDSVREAAVTALDNRPRDEYRELLLDGFRYPWLPAADHAAEALVALKDTESVPKLVDLLSEPSPTAPFLRSNDKLLATRELVRVNHLGNCTMCHARSTGTVDPVRGRIPSPYEPLPPPVQYYDAPGGFFVRADVTYLKQDFSVPQPVEKHAHWPSSQRYDYMVRSRTLTPAEIDVLRAKKMQEEMARAQLGTNHTTIFEVPEPRYPQRESVLFALRELTGRDAGPASASWRKLYAFR